MGISTSSGLSTRSDSDRAFDGMPIYSYLACLVSPVSRFALAGLALLLVARRLSGGLVIPLQWPAAFALSCLAVAMAAGGLWVGRNRFQKSGSQRPSQAHDAGEFRRRIAVLPIEEMIVGLALLLLGLAIWIPATPSATVFGYLLPIAIFVGALLGRERLRSMLNSLRRSQSVPHGGIGEEVDEETAVESSAIATEFDAEQSHESIDLQTLVQQMTRLRKDGVETIEGTVAVGFEPGQRSAAAHLAFCPPFSKVPTGRADLIDWEGSVTVTRVLSYGARLEVRLAEASEEPITIAVAYAFESRVDV